MKTKEQVRELRGLPYRELASRLEEAHQELFNLRFRLATRQLANYRELPRVRRAIARIRTLMRERELSGEIE